MSPLFRLFSRASRSGFVVLWLALAARLGATTPLDSVIFGDAASETAHAFSATLAVAAVGPAGTGLNQPYRYLTPRSPLGIYGGEMSFQLAVDPVRRNYFSVKLWGGDDNGADSGRLYVYVTLDGADYQMGYRHEGDHMANFSNGGSTPSLPGRFFYSTLLLPLWMTQGRSALTFKIVSSGRIYTLGSGYEGDGGNYQFNMQQNSRGLYRAYTHVEPMLDPAGEVQGSAPVPVVKPQNGATSYLGSGGSFYNAVKGQINNRLNGTPSLTNSLYYPDGVEFLAYAYFTSGQINGSQTALPGYQNAAVVTRVRDLLDLYAANHYANPSQVSAFGNLGWGGAYGALGYAVHLLQSQFAADLDVVADYGAAGGSKTRRQAWGDMLHASREYGRTSRDGRAITNQCLLSDENLYKANKGLLALGDARAFSEAAAKRYLREGIGLDPWLGSDLAGGGSSQPHGGAYYQVTAKGLSREWGFVGSNYGEMQRMAARFYRLTGDTAFRDQAVKMLRARAPFRRPNFEVSGASCYANMVVTGFLAWRGAGESDGNGYAGETAYGDRSGALAGLLTAAATGDAHALGYAKQMLADRQFFSSLDDSGGDYDTLNALDVFADYVTVNSAADPGHRLPMTEGQPDFAWADEEGGIVALKHGGERLWIAPFWQAKTGTGINGVARFHYSNGTWDQIGTMETTPRFTFGGSFFVRPNLIDKPETDFYVPPSPPLNAYAGEKLPLGLTPAGASSDAPFRGRADFYAFRFGPYLFGLNCSAAQSFALKTPKGFVSATDLFTDVVRSGTVIVPAASTVALYLDSATDVAPVPATPAWLDIAVGAAGPELSWAAASGATGYTVRRATAAGGPYAIITTGPAATTYTDADAISGVTYYYTVAATNAHGESYPSHENSIIAVSGAAILGFDFAPASDTTMTAADKAGAPGVRAARWNRFSGGTLSTGIVDAGGGAVPGLSVTLSNGNNGGFSDRGGSTGDEASFFRTVLDKFDGSSATLTVTGIPYAAYDVYFYVYGDENTAGANDRGGSFTVGGVTNYIRTGTATRVTGPGGYLRSADTSFGTGMDVDLGNYVRFENLTGSLSATFTARNINGGAQRLKVAGFQIVGRTAAAPSGLAALPGEARVDLAWNAVAGATAYAVKRATVSGGPYARLAADLAEPGFVDTTAANGVIYYYVVTAANAAGESTASAEVSAMPLSALMAWRLVRFGIADSTGAAADEADPDRDGLPNLLEYALAGEPLDAGSSPCPTLQVAVGEGLPALVFTFERIADPALVYTVERSGDLATWAEIWTSGGGNNVAGPVTLTEPLPGSAQARVFLRLRVER